MSYIEGDLRAPQGARFAIIASRWNPRIVDALVDAALDECERYYPVFQFVLWGGKSPRDALTAAMVETEGEA